MSIVRKAGSVDVSVVVRIIDSVDGTPETGVTAATGGLVLEYRRELEAEVSLATIVDLAALTTAHTDKGILHIGDGYYRVDLPDAACATGQVGVLVHGVATGMVVIGEYIQLVAYDPFDTVRLGLTALPSAAAEAAGGLYTRGSGAGQINQSANGMVDTNPVRLNNVAQSLLDLKDFADDGYDPATNKVEGVKLADALSAAGVQAIWDALTSALTTAGSVGKRIADNLDAAVTSRMATFTLPANFAALAITAGGLVDVTQAAADKVWGSATRTLTAFSTGLAVSVWDVLESAVATAASIGLKVKTNLDAAVSSRLATAGYTAPDNAGIAAIKAKTDNLPSDPADQSLVIAATDAVMARLGVPAGASVSADVLAVKGDTAAVKLKTDNLPGLMKKGVAFANFDFVMVDSADHVTPKTGLTVAGTIRKDGGAFAALTNAPTEVANGVYTVGSLTAAELTADKVTLRFTAAGADTRVIEFVLNA